MQYSCVHAFYISIIPKRRTIKRNVRFRKDNNSVRIPNIIIIIRKRLECSVHHPCPADGNIITYTIERFLYGFRIDGVNRQSDGFTGFF